MQMKHKATNHNLYFPDSLIYLKCNSGEHNLIVFMCMSYELESKNPFDQQINRPRSTNIYNEEIKQICEKYLQSNIELNFIRLFRSTT